MAGEVAREFYRPAKRCDDEAADGTPTEILRNRFQKEGNQRSQKTEQQLGRSAATAEPIMSLINQL